MNTNDIVGILELIANRCEGNFENVDNRFSLLFGSHQYTDEISSINHVISNMESMNKNHVALYNDTVYEIALDRRLDIVRFLDRSDMGVIEDCENKIKYTIGVASTEYLLWMLSSLNEREVRRLRDFSGPRSSLIYRIERQENNQGSIGELLGIIFRTVITLKIQCNEAKTEKQFEQLFDAFRFQTASNYNSVIMPINEFRDLCMTMGGGRYIESLSEITAPKRIYMPDLTNQYYMGVSSKLPFVEFICYYHVMEYFFEKVYNDDMIKGLQDKISSPRFSVKKEQDIKDIVKYVTRKVHDKNERYDINELEALELVLKKYIDITELQNILQRSAIDYYRTTEVPFSKGDMVDFNDITNPKIFKKLAARIYKTRNSIIHSKSGEKAVYSPFTDEEALEKEIPLLRYIAEEIIIKTSVMM